MTQELVMACFIQALDIAPKHRPSNIQAFLAVGALNGKLVENLRKIGGKLVDKVLATVVLYILSPKRFSDALFLDKPLSRGSKVTWQSKPRK